MYPTRHHHNLVILLGFLAILGVIGWYVGKNFFHRDQTDTPSTDELDISMTDLKFLSAKEVLARIDRQENLLLIDIRLRENYDLEHIVDSISVPAAMLSSFSPGSSQFVILITGSELPNDTLKGAHLLFTQRKFQFAFLQGTLADWRSAGGITLSSGDPESSLDYSKVIFIENAAVMPLVSQLVSPLFLDVRDKNAYDRSHLPGAINIPLDELEQRRSDIPQQKSIFVYGANDFESYQGGVRLFDLGFLGNRSIRGGFTAWQEQKLPVESSSHEAINTQKP